MGNENPITPQTSFTSITDTGWTPMSVRSGSRRKRFGWWVKDRRQALALKLAPWLNPAPLAVYHFHVSPTGTTFTESAPPEARP